MLTTRGALNPNFVYNAGALITNFAYTLHALSENFANTARAHKKRSPLLASALRIVTAVKTRSARKDASVRSDVFPHLHACRKCRARPLPRFHSRVIQQLFISGDEERSWPNTKPVPQRTPQYRLYSSTPCTFPGWCARSPRIPLLKKKGGPHTNQQTKPPRLVLLDILWLYAYASDVSVSYLASLFRLVSFLRFFDVKFFVTAWTCRCRLPLPHLP